MDPVLKRFCWFRLLATSYMWVPAMIPFMKSRGLNFQTIMMLGAIYCVVVIAAEIPTGAFADRVGRKLAMTVGSLAMAASCLVAIGSHSFAGFAVAEALSALSMSLVSGADSAYLFDYLSRKGRLSEYTALESSSSAWHLWGKAGAYGVGGFLASIQLWLPFVATAVTALMAAGLALSLGEKASGSIRQLGPRAYTNTMRSAALAVRNNARLVWVIAYSTLAFILLQITQFLYQPYLESHGFNLVETGLVYSLVYVIASTVAGQGMRLRMRMGEPTMAWGLLLLLGSSFLALATLSSAWAIPLLGMQAIAQGLYSPLVKPMMNRQIGDSYHRATVLSFESIARRTAMGVFQPAVGAMGATVTISVCGIIGLAGALSLFVTSRWAPFESGE